MQRVFEPAMKKKFWIWVSFFLWVASEVEFVFGHFGSDYLALGPWKYFAQVLIGN